MPHILIYGYGSYGILATLFWLVYCMWFILEMLVSFRKRASKTDVRERGSLFALLGGLYIGLVIGFTSPYFASQADITWNQPLLVSVGIVLMILGIFFRQYAIKILGVAFTCQVAVRADQQVVQSGPYRYIRHPSYSGGLLTVLGVGIAITNWVGLPGLIVLTFAGYLYRVLVEEKALRVGIGEPYIEYMRHTKRLIPFIF